MNLYKIFFLSSLFLIKCASNPVSDTLDEWKEQKNDSYWYGTAIISKKHFNGIDIHEAAHSQAISNIASQIKINISKEFRWVVEEENYNIDDYSIQILNTRVNNNIEDVEIIDFKDLKDSYILFAKLSKQKFYDSIKRKSENAADIAKEYILNSTSPSLLSFENLANAEKAILPYIDYPIKVDINGVNVNLYSFIQNMRNDLINRIMVEPENDKVYIKSLVSNEEAINIKVYDKNTNTALSKIPLVVTINEVSSNCLTDENGECVFIIDLESLNMDKKQYAKINIDKENLIQKNSNYDFNINSQVLIDILSTKIYLNVEEYNLDSRLEHTYIDSVIKEFFIKKFNVEFVNNVDDSDISIKVYATTRKNGNRKNEYGIYQAYSDATIKVESSNSYITDISINDVKGADFRSFEQAGNKSLEKISKQILKETLPKLVDILSRQ